MPIFMDFKSMSFAPYGWLCYPCLLIYFKIRTKLYHINLITSAYKLIFFFKKIFFLSKGENKNELRLDENLLRKTTLI